MAKRESGVSLHVLESQEPRGDSLTFKTRVIMSDHFLRPPNMLTTFFKDPKYSKDPKFSETPQNYVD